MRTLWVVAWLLAALAPVSAQFSMMVQKPMASAASFVGVLDEEPTVTMCVGLNACSGALATSGSVAADLCGATGCTAAVSCPSIRVAASGQLDTTSGTYCGNGTTGGVYTVSQYCSLVKTCMVGGTARLSGLWEQTGESIHFTTGSYSVAPDFILSGVNGDPTFGCVSSRSTYLSATINALSAPYSAGITFERTSAFTTLAFMAVDTSAGFGLINGGAANEAGWYVSGASVLATGVTDGAGTTDFSHFHNMLVTAASSQAVDIYLDGAAPLTFTQYTAATSTTMGICGGFAYANAFVRRVWWDKTTPGSTVGENVTSQSKVGL